MSADSYSIAVYGACGAVGREVLTALEGEGLDIRELIPVGATMATGMQASWRSRQLQMKSGRRSQVIPGARIWWMVVMKFTPVRMEERQAENRPRPMTAMWAWE